MTAPKGNKYAKGCETSGRPRKFSNPYELLQLFYDYKKEVFENPIVITETTLKPHGTEIKTINRHRPLTWDAFELYVGILTLRSYKNDYKEYSQVITRIDYEIRNNKFEGASAGVFNSNIIARDLGLRDKSELISNVQILNIDPLDE